MPDRAGEKRERLSIEAVTETPDSHGQPIKVWRIFGTMWARAEFLYGRELEAMQKINSEISTRFTVNYRADITEKMRITWRSTSWNIHSIRPTEDKFDMFLFASVVK